MFKLAGVITLAVLVLSVAAAAYGRSSLTDEEKLAKGWIVSYVSYESDDSIANLEVKALINASPKKVWEFLSKVERWSLWMPVMSRGWALGDDALSKVPASPEKTKDVYDVVSVSSPAAVRVSGSGKTTVSTFEEFDLPWPINNDWVLRKYIFDASKAEEDIYKVEWKQIFKGAERRGGRWELSRYNGEADETLFEYRFRVKRKEGVPQKVFEIIMGKTVERFVSAIRKNV